MMLDHGSSVLSAEEMRALIPEDVRVYFGNYVESDEEKLREKLGELRRHCTTFGYAGAVLKNDTFTAKNALALKSLISPMKLCGRRELRTS